MLASIFALAWGCSSFRTYYSEYSTQANLFPGAGNNSKRLPVAEHGKSTGEKALPPASGPPAPSTEEADRARAAAEAMAESNKAAAASAAALKASEEAAKAAREASEAAARVAASPSPSAQSTPAELMLSYGEAGETQNRQHVAEMLEKLNQRLATIDRKSLTADGLSRTELAEKFLQGAQKAFVSGSYAEAGSLAAKASTILAPVAGTTRAAPQ